MYTGGNQDKETWLTLDQVRSQLEPAKWKHDRLLEEVSAATAQGRFPSDFWSAPRQDQAYILAYYRVIRVMEAFENLLAKKQKP